MLVLKTPSEIREHIRNLKAKEKISIGFVPTMGALHQGHVSLFRNARKDNDIVVGSIFVNPIQFNNKKDYELYPKNFDKDINILEQAGCDILFTPDEKELYDSSPQIKIDFGHLTEVMEGKHRPGHFNGVAIIVAKLFNIVEPDVAYFGQKDLQQFKVIEKMVKDLSFPVTLRMCPTIREDDGLAMSSRNVRIKEAHRLIAAKIYGALGYAADLITFGDDVHTTSKKVADFISKFKPLELEYFEVRDAENLALVKDVKEHDSVALCISVYLDEVRLIDNVIINI